MTDQAKLLTLLQISDTTFPTGAFGFSGGFERLIGDGWVSTPQDLQRILLDDVLPRWFEFDRFYVRHSHRSFGQLDALRELDEECDAQMYMPALRDASLTTGRGILTSHAKRGTTGAGDILSELRAGGLLGHAAIVQGMVGSALDLDEQVTEVGALHGVVMSHVSAAVRLGTLGALEALPLLAAAASAAAEHMAQPLPDSPRSFAPFLEIAANRKAQNGAQLLAN